ncbi:MAG: class I SAM-dependent methyltransferase [Chloroflexi bacterium]|nr:class I SAM-dependent methyltransferase [Chloroflexota bacterium]
MSRLLTPALLRWLQQDERAVSELAALTARPLADKEILPTLSHLRRRFSPEQAAALMEMARLRRRAATKFPQTHARMFFESEALQQASSAMVAAYRAQRFQGRQTVMDLGCGLGADALALAGQGCFVVAVDYDPLRLALTAANARALALAQRVHPVMADIIQPAWRGSAAWADPHRRLKFRRIFDPEQLRPPLSNLLATRAFTPNLGVKLMPGLSHEAIPPEAEAEWISVKGQLKECTLWFGELCREPVRRATILPAAASLVARGAQASVRSPGAYLFEPDPAVIRAGAVGDLAASFGLWQIDAQIAYLSGDQWLKSPFLRGWRILEHQPFHLKTLNRRLRDMNARVAAVKKRGAAIEPEAFRRRLVSLPRGRPVIVVLTRVNDKPWMLIVEAVI